MFERLKAGQGNRRESAGRERVAQTGQAMDLSPQSDEMLLKGTYPVPVVGRWVHGCDMIKGCSK